MYHMNAATEYVPTKPNANCRSPWEALVVRKKRDNMKIAILLNKENPTNVNVQIVKKAHKELTHTKKNKTNTFLEYLGHG